jgi:hypothetical protein
MNAPGNAEAPEKTWKHVTTLALWLYLMTPVGLWKLWKDTILTPSAKWRVLIYVFVLPILVYVTVSFWSANHMLQRYLP